MAGFVISALMEQAVRQIPNGNVYSSIKLAIHTRMGRDECYRSVSYLGIRSWSEPFVAIKARCKKILKCRAEGFPKPAS